MFKADTTLILGAGASMYYGYPSGAELVGKIFRMGLPDNLKDLPHSGIDRESSQAELSRRIKIYDPLSIDAFLWHYRDVANIIEVAKRSIAEIILVAGLEDKFQRPEVIDKDNPAGHWYSLLWQAITSEASAEDLSDPDKSLRLNIITFNYDASLEYFLYKMVMNSGSFIHGEQAAQFLEKLSNCIHHVYGCVQPYEWCGGNVRNDLLSLAGESAGDHEDLVESNYTNIKLIGERDGNYEDLQDLIRKSMQTIFLGFGFDETNIGDQVLNLARSLVPRDASADTGANWLPVIKYTNYSSSDKIDQSVRRELARAAKIGKDENHVSSRALSHSVTASPDTAYNSLNDKFNLTTI